MSELANFDLKELDINDRTPTIINCKITICQHLIDFRIKEIDQIENELDNTNEVEKKTDLRKRVQTAEEVLTVLYKKMGALKVVQLELSPEKETESSVLSKPGSPVLPEIPNLPCLQWKAHANSSMIFNSKKPYYETPIIALQAFGKALTAPELSKDFLQQNWPHYIKKAMNPEQKKWYEKNFGKTLAKPPTWEAFCGEYLSQYNQTKSINFLQYESRLDYYYIRMVPGKETLKSYLIRFHNLRKNVGQPDDAVSATLLVESLPLLLKSKVIELLASVAEPNYLTNCERAQRLIERASDYLASQGQSAPNDKISPVRLPVDLTNQGFKLAPPILSKNARKKKNAKAAKISKVQKPAAKSTKASRRKFDSEIDIIPKITHHRFTD